MTFLKTLAAEKIKFEIFSYSVFVTVMLYVFSANQKVTAAFFGKTIYVFANMLLAAYTTYQNDRDRQESNSAEKH